MSKVSLKPTIGTLSFDDLLYGVDVSAGTSGSGKLTIAALRTALFAGGGGYGADPLALAAGTTDSAPLNLPHGVAPTAPVDGDVWTTSAGIYVRVSGVTVGPLGAGGGGGAVTSVFTRTGDVVAESGDYTFAQIASTPTTLAGYGITDAAALAGATFTGPLITVASAVGAAGFNLPHGAAPTAPVDGDVWTTTAGIYARINGATVGPLGSGGGGGGVDGTGTAGKLAKWSDTDTLEDSIISESGSVASIAGTLKVGTSDATAGTICLPAGTGAAIIGIEVATTAGNKNIPLRVDGSNQVLLGTTFGGGYFNSGFLLYSGSTNGRHIYITGSGIEPIGGVGSLGSASNRWNNFYVNAIRSGGAPAGTGAIRMTHAEKIVGRNATNNGDIDLLSVQAGNVVTLGQAGVPIALLASVVNLGDAELNRPMLSDISEKVHAMTFSATPTFDYAASDGTHKTMTLTANITSVTISNWPASGRLGAMTLFLLDDATGGRTIAGWPAAVDWGDDGPPPAGVANKLRIITLLTTDGGTNIYGSWKSGHA